MKDSKAKQKSIKQHKKTTNLKSTNSTSDDYGVSGWGFSCGGIIPPKAIKQYLKSLKNDNKQ